jgi:hypothetical protein
MPDSMTQLISAGPVGTKINIAVLGDGFAAGDQDIYNQKVDDLLIKGVFEHDYFAEDRQAFNIFRVNLISHHSGVGVKTYNSDGVLTSTVTQDTALGIYFNGNHAHCWVEDGANTATLLAAALAKWVPDHTLVLVLLNNGGFGGCGGGGRATLPLGVTWDTVAHEFGHALGGFADEYCGSETFSGAEPNRVNITKSKTRAALKWKQFVKDATPIPTGVGACATYTEGTKPAGWDSHDDVGTFEGASSDYNRGIYRPVLNCRMNGNSPPYCPVCYTAMKQKNDARTGHDFSQCHVGDFNGDGKDDVLIHTGNSLAIYRSNGSQLDFVWSAVGKVPGWHVKANDQIHVADFNGDGKKEVLIYNGVDWSKPQFGMLADDGHNGLTLIKQYDGSLPNWQMGPDDRFFVGDFHGDGKVGVLAVNTTHWSHKWVGVFRSTGTELVQTALFDNKLPNWQIGTHDQFHVGDFNADGKADLYVSNTVDWSHKWVGMFRSNGTTLTQTALYDNNLPGWQMGAHDQIHVGDFDGDGKADLYVFNGDDWSHVWLGMLTSDGSGLHMHKLYDGSVPNWQMAQGDKHLVADVTGDGKADLIVWNYTHWTTRYLGAMVSSGSGVSAHYASNFVGEWNLGTVDQLKVCDFEGVPGRRDLFVHNKDWFGMMRMTPTPVLQKIYYRFIHNYRHGRNW